MVNKIGDLTTGAATAVTVGTHTIYTVPSGKAAKGKIMFHALAANTGTISIAVNGVTIASPTAATGADNFFSSNQNLVENTTTTAPTGIAADTTVAPCPQEYFLSAGDVVTYTVGVVDLTTANFQFVGTEVDVT